MDWGSRLRVDRHRPALLVQAERVAPGGVVADTQDEIPQLGRER
jgi:hypothetical protein